MLALTHAAIAAAGTSLILGTAEPLSLSLAVVGSQLPDIDTTTSFVGQVFFPISSWIEDRYPHRSITHSLAASILLGVLSFFCGYYWLGYHWKIWLALPLGHLLACFSDCFTRQGVQLFWPERVWCISVSNPRRRLVTGSSAEYWVLAVAIAVLVVAVNVNSQGSFASVLGSRLGLADEIARQYRESAASHHVWANVKGYRVGDRTPIEGKFFILDGQGDKFTITDGEAIWRTGAEIEIEKLSIEEGDRVIVKVEPVEFRDELVSEKLRSHLSESSASWVSGSIAVEFGDEIRVTTKPFELQTINVAGDNVNLSYHPLEQAIADLADQYGTGTLTIKSFTPSPFQ